MASAADDDASVGPITEGARPVAGAAGRDASAVGPVAKAASADNAAKDSQTGQTLPLQGRIAVKSISHFTWQNLSYDFPQSRHGHIRLLEIWQDE